MLTQETVDAFNSRLTVDLNTIKTMRPAQLDQVKSQGSNAEALLKNRDFALFVHQYKFEILDSITAVTGHREEDNSRRVALSNQLAGIDGFVASLQRAVHMKNRVVSNQATATGNPRDPAESLNERTYQ
jgi:hypothetical protein